MSGINSNDSNDNEKSNRADNETLFHLLSSSQPPMQENGPPKITQTAPAVVSIPWEQQQQPPVVDDGNTHNNPEKRNIDSNNDDNDRKKTNNSSKRKMIRLLVCSGNLGNQQPDAASLAAWIPADGATRPVVVGTGDTTLYPLRCYPTENGDNASFRQAQAPQPQQPQQQFQHSAHTIPKVSSTSTPDGDQGRIPTPEMNGQDADDDDGDDDDDDTILEQQQHDEEEEEEEEEQFDLIVIGMQEATFEPPKTSASTTTTTTTTTTPVASSPPTRAAAATDSEMHLSFCPAATCTTANTSTSTSIPSLASLASVPSSPAPSSPAAAAAPPPSSSSSPVMIKLHIPIVQPLVTKGLKKTVGTIAQFTANRDFTKTNSSSSPSNNAANNSAISSSNTNLYNIFQIPLTEWNGGTKVLHQLLRARLPSYRHVVSFQRGQMRLEVFSLCRRRDDHTSQDQNHAGGGNSDKDHKNDSGRYFVRHDDILDRNEDSSDNHSLHDYCPVQVLQTSAQNTGLAGLANKGGIVTQLYMPTHALRLSFVTCHLEAHEGLTKYHIRCNSLADIFHGTTPKKKDTITTISMTTTNNPTTACTKNNNKNNINSKRQQYHDTGGCSGWHDVSISSHHCFVLGDLNFRTDACRFLGNEMIQGLGIPNENSNNVGVGDNDDEAVWHNRLIRKWVQQRDWESLNAVDELHHALRVGDVLQGGFTTLFCNFPPTFKLARLAGCFGASSATSSCSPNDNNAGQNGDDGDSKRPSLSSASLAANDDLLYTIKRRPSYTDRILWKSNHELQAHIRPMIYEPIEAFASSDHKPVRAAFEISAPPTVCFSSPPSSSSSRRGRRVQPRRNSPWLRKGIIRRDLPVSSPPQPTLGREAASRSSMWVVAGGSSAYNGFWLGSSRMSSKWSMGNGGGVDSNHNSNDGAAVAVDGTSQERAMCILPRQRSRRRKEDSRNRDRLDLFVSNLSCKIYHEKDGSSNSINAKAPPNPYVVLVSSPEEALRLVPQHTFWTRFKQNFRRLFIQPFNCASHEHFIDQDEVHSETQDNKHGNRQQLGQSLRSLNGVDSATADGATCMRTECGWPRTSRKFATFEPAWDAGDHAITDHVAIRTRVQTRRLDGSYIDLTGAMLHLTVLDFKTNAEDVVIGTCTFNLANLLRKCRTRSPPLLKQQSLATLPHRRSVRSSFRLNGRATRGRDTEQHSSPMNGAPANITGSSIFTTVGDANRGASLYRNPRPFQSVRDIFGGGHSGRSGPGSAPKSIQEKLAHDNDGDDDTNDNPVTHCEINSILVKNGRETGSIRFEIEVWWMDAATARLLGTIPTIAGRYGSENGSSVNLGRGDKTTGNKSSRAVLCARHQMGRRASPTPTPTPTPG